MRNLSANASQTCQPISNVHRSESASLAVRNRTNNDALSLRCYHQMLMVKKMYFLRPLIESFLTQSFRNALMNS